MNCENCENEHDGSYGSGRFCGPKCARSFSTKARRQEINKKVSRAMSQPERLRFCSSCKKRISKSGKSGKCNKCLRSSPDYKKKLSKALKGKVGGPRLNSGRSKSGYYKGIYCGSTYELIYVIYRIDHGLRVERFKGILRDNLTSYQPDFIEDGKIIEIKGYHTALVDRKTQLAYDHGYKVDILYKEDLKREFEWVKNNYSYKQLQELYDDYKPKFTYICWHCDREFTTERKRKTTIYFCSQSCTGLYSKGSEARFSPLSSGIVTRQPLQK